MPRDFLAYWKPGTADHQIAEGGNLGHSASNQFSRVRAGDAVWLVTIREGELFLLGRILAGQVTNQTEASRLLNTSDLWEAEHHILAAEGTDQAIRDLPISHLANDLRFESPTGRVRLKIEDDFINPQQLQVLRVLTPDSARLLEVALSAGTPFCLPEEIDPNAEIVEGATRQISVNTYERSEEARRLCLAYHGANCCVCGFSFGRAYGRIADGFIHVHHIRPLSEIRGEYKVDPVKDLRPVCPNCHAIIHLRRPALSIEEAKALLRRHEE